MHPGTTAIRSTAIFCFAAIVWLQPIKVEADPLSRHVMVGVEPFGSYDADAKKCGISPSAIENRIDHVLTSATWSVEPAAPSAVYAQIYVMYFERIDTCVFSSFVGFLRPLNTDAGHPISGITVFRNAAGVFPTNLASSGSIYLIEESVKGIIGEAEIKGL